MKSLLSVGLLFVLLPLVASAQDMPLTQVLIDGEDWQLLSDGYRFTEGPAVDRQGNVYFTDIPNSKIHRIGLDGKVTLFAENTARTNGLMFGPDGKLYGCRNGDKQIVAYTQDGKYEVIAENVGSNDLVVTSDGTIYFTDPRGGKLWYIDEDRKVRMVAQGLEPNGVILWPGEGTLVVTDRSNAWLWTFRVEKDGSLSYKDKYYLPLFMPSGRDRPGTDGMTVDRDGRLYVTSFSGLQMFDPTGRMGGVIAKPQLGPLSNAVFGGADFRFLYVTAGDKVYRRRVKPAGAPYFLRAKAK